MLTDRFSEALTYAESLHRSQTRKGNAIPYAAHLLTVCATVLEWGGDEDTAIAALLHDAVEDQGGVETLNEIRGRFGTRVAEIVAACSDSTTGDQGAKAPWRQRKEAHVQKLELATSDVALVTAADKLHNLAALIRDVRRKGPATMDRFNAGPDQIIWFHRAVARALARYGDTMPIADLEEATETLARLLKVAAAA